MQMGKPEIAPLEPPRFEDGEPMLIAGLAQRHRGTNAGIPDQWLRFAPHIGNIPGQVGCAAYGVVFDSLEDACSFGYLAGVEVSDLGGLPEGFGHLEIPAQRYAVFSHRGHVSGIARTMGAIMGEWLPSSGNTRVTDGADFLERYGEEFDPQTGMGGVEVWIPIKP